MADGNDMHSMGQSHVVPLGKGQASSNSELNVKGDWVKGTVSAREMMTLGGDKDEGKLVGKRVSPGAGTGNVGDREKDSSSSFVGDLMAKYEAGTVSPREPNNKGTFQKYGGGGTTGKLVGDGAGATAAAKPEDQLKGGQVQPGMDLLRGTSDGDKNMSRAMRGLGSGKNRRND